MQLIHALTPIFICVALPIAIVYIVFRSITNRENKRAEILIKAIETNNGIDADKLAESLNRRSKTPRELLNARLLRGCMFTLVGFAFLIYGIYIPEVSMMNTSFLIGAILTAIGISYLIVYFITRKQVEDSESK